MVVFFLLFLLLLFSVLFYVSFVPKMAQRFSQYTHTDTYSKWRGALRLASTHSHSHSHGIQLRVFFFRLFSSGCSFYFIAVYFYGAYSSSRELKLNCSTAQLLKLALNAPLFQLTRVICISPCSLPSLPFPFAFCLFYTKNKTPNNPNMYNMRSVGRSSVGLIIWYCFTPSGVSGK